MLQQTTFCAGAFYRDYVVVVGVWSSASDANAIAAANNTNKYKTL